MKTSSMSGMMGGSSQSSMAAGQKKSKKRGGDGLWISHGLINEQYLTVAAHP